MVNKNGLMFEYYVPINSSATLDGDFMIEGIAINETTTSNGHKFIAEELRNSAHTMIGVPLLKDHNNSVDSIVGRVKIAGFNEEMKNIPFKAIVKDAKMKELIKDGLLGTVSVGAHVDPSDIEEGENGEIIPHNIQFKELSLVAVPADQGATFGVALNNAYQGFKENNSKISERGIDKMTEETIKEETTVETPEIETKEEPKEDVSEKILTLLSTMDKRLAKLESSDVDEVKPEVEEPKPEETKEEEEVESDEVEESGDYKFSEGHKSFSVERKSYNY